MTDEFICALPYSLSEASVAGLEPDPGPLVESFDGEALETPALDFRTRPHWLVEHVTAGGGWVDETSPLDRDAARRSRELSPPKLPDGLCLICGAPALRYRRETLRASHQDVVIRGARDAAVERVFELPLELPYCAAHYAEHFSAEDSQYNFEAALPEANRFTAPQRSVALENELLAPGLSLSAVFDAGTDGFLLRWRWHCDAYRAAFIEHNRGRLEELGARVFFLGNPALEEAELGRGLRRIKPPGYAVGVVIFGSLLTVLALTSPSLPGWWGAIFALVGGAGLGVLLKRLVRREALVGRLRKLRESRG